MNEPYCAPMPFTVATPGLETTPLPLMLNAHSLLTISPETGFLLVVLGAQWAVGCLARILVFAAEARSWRKLGLAREALVVEPERIRPSNPADGLRAFSAKPSWFVQTPTTQDRWPQVDCDRLKRTATQHFPSETAPKHSEPKPRGCN